MKTEAVLRIGVIPATAALLACASHAAHAQIVDATVYKDISAHKRCR